MRAQPRLGGDEPRLAELTGAHATGLDRGHQAGSFERAHVLHEGRERHGMLSGQRGQRLVALPQPRQHGSPHWIGQGGEREIQTRLVNHEVKF
jgi:hypothetical protein